MNYKDFRDGRTMEAYEKYLRGETFKKARAIITQNGKVVLVHDIGKNVTTLPGGGVDEGESVLDAAKREAKEETGYEVEPVMIVDKDSYDVPMKIGDIDFVSTREAFFVVCKLLSKSSGQGLEGEYEKGREIVFENIAALKNLHLSDSAIEAVLAFDEAQSKREQ